MAEDDRGAAATTTTERLPEGASRAVRPLLSQTMSPPTVTDACPFFLKDDGTSVPCVATLVRSLGGGGDPVLVQAGWGGGEELGLTVSTRDKPASFCGTWSLPKLAEDLERLGPAITSEIAERAALGRNGGGGSSSFSWGVGSHAAGDVAAAIAALWSEAGRPTSAPCLSVLRKTAAAPPAGSPPTLLFSPSVDVSWVRHARIKKEMGEGGRADHD